MEAFEPVEAYKCIYVIRVNDKAHRGLLKVGDATVRSDLPVDRLSPNTRPLNEAARERIKSYTGTAGIEYELLHTELAVKSVKNPKTGEMALRAFRDHDVHEVLRNSGIEPRRIGETSGREWYPADLETVEEAIAAVKSSSHNLSGTGVPARTPIVFRPEQDEAIKDTIRQFAKSDHMLWNAKMRFGKTLAALEVVKRMGFRRTIIMTHRPVVDAGWYEDFNKIFGAEDGYVYSSKNTDDRYAVERLLKENRNFVYFASIQDLRGSSKVGGRFDKNGAVFETTWDCVIVDEAHEGTQTTLGDETVRAVAKEGLGRTKVLMLSGTPFNIVGSFGEDEVYTWDYIMEQEAKSEWDKLHFGDSNPYEELPALRILTYDLGDILRNEAYQSGEDLAFNFAEFFRVSPDDDRFVHERDVRSFLSLLTRDDVSSNYPFSREPYRDLFRHSLWMVPGVAAAKALKGLMAENPVFGSGQFEIVNVAGDGDEESTNALSAVKGAIAEAERKGTYTITLSCGKLTTGVTVPEWTAVLMLAGSYATSAANYLQTIFRVQSPCNKDGKVKETAYVFDFAPDRTLKMVSKAVAVSARAGKTSSSDREALGKFLNFCPVIGISGSKMVSYDTARLLQQLKRAYAERVVDNGFDDPCLYSDALLELTDIDVDAFNDLKAKIGEKLTKKQLREITINDQGLTDEQYEEAERLERKPKRELTPEEKERLEKLKEAKDRRRNAIAILTGISIRMPLLIFGADVPYDDDITLDQFVDLVDEDSWAEFMPGGVTKEVFGKFRRFYDEDVFVAAGRRIRNVARYADTLAPTERTKRIAGLFSHFKNPDKETVLTPWNVVNMHMSETIGGWDFWDEDHSEPLDKPRFVNRGPVTHMVIESESSNVLEINSKSGLYPLYVAYSMFRARAGEKIESLSAEKQQAIWAQVVRSSVFVVCKTPMAKTITRRTLIGYKDWRINAHHFDDLVNTMKNKPKQFTSKVTKGSWWKVEAQDMRFSAVVGNPPYQMDDGGHGSSASPVYQYFVETAIGLNPSYVSMITPSRWFAGGKGLDDFRKRMLSDHRLSAITDFPKLYQPFPAVKIRGGISYFLWDRSHDGPCTIRTIEDGKQTGDSATRYLDAYDVLIRRNEAVSILDKVRALEEPTLDGRISSAKPFGWRTYYHGESSSKNMSNPVKLYGSQRISWVEKDSIPLNTPWVDEWKVLTTEAQGTSSAIETKFLSKPIIAGPGTACTETYIVDGRFNTEDEARNYASYLRTRFVRFLVSLRKPTQHTTRDVFAFVPDVSYDHPWTDAMLYKKYGLTKEEIAFVESQVAEQIV